MLNLPEIKSDADFEKILKESFTRPVLLFKYSPVCPISHYAERQLGAFLQKSPPGAPGAGSASASAPAAASGSSAAPGVASVPAADFSAYAVDVIGSRPVSRAIADKTGVVHQSPQALLFKDGRPIWHESHGELHQEIFAQALAAAGATSDA